MPNRHKANKKAISPSKYCGEWIELLDESNTQNVYEPQQKEEESECEAGHVTSTSLLSATV